MIPNYTPKVGDELIFKDGFYNFIKDKNIDIVHIQYHSGSFYPTKSLEQLIDYLKALNVKVIVTLHAVRNVNFDFIKEIPNLKNADTVLIHNQEDYEYAKKAIHNASKHDIESVALKIFENYISKL